MEQRKMPMVGAIQKPKPLPIEEIQRCETALEAINLCVQRAHYRKNYVIAELIGMNASFFSKCLNGHQNFPPDKIEELEDVCGNTAYSQYRAWRRGWQQPELDERQQRIRDLEAELHELKETAAA